MLALLLAVAAVSATDEQSALMAQMTSLVKCKPLNAASVCAGLVGMPFPALDPKDTLTAMSRLSRQELSDLTGAKGQALDLLFQTLKTVGGDSIDRVMAALVGPETADFPISDLELQVLAAVESSSSCEAVPTELMCMLTYLKFRGVCSDPELLTTLSGQRNKLTEEKLSDAVAIMQTQMGDKMPCYNDAQAAMGGSGCLALGEEVLMLPSTAATCKPISDFVSYSTMSVSRYEAPVRELPKCSVDEVGVASEAASRACVAVDNSEACGCTDELVGAVLVASKCFDETDALGDFNALVGSMAATACNQPMEDARAIISAARANLGDPDNAMTVLFQLEGLVNQQDALAIDFSNTNTDVMAVASQQEGDFMPEPPTPEELPGCYDNLQEGEGLVEFASRHNKLWTEIWNMNPDIVDPDIIPDGKQVRIGIPYMVRAEDSLYSIATRYGTTWDKIVDATASVPVSGAVDEGTFVCVIPEVKNILCNMAPIVASA